MLFMDSKVPKVLYTTATEKKLKKKNSEIIKIISEKNMSLQG